MNKFITLLFAFLMSFSCSHSQGVGKGQRIDMTDVLHLDRNGGQFAQIFIPDYFVPNGQTYDLVFHLHSASWAAEDEVYKAKANAILFNIHLGAFSSPYQFYFSQTDRFRTVLKQIRETLIQKGIVSDSTQIRYLILTSFSAGYAGVREILKSDTYYKMITALHLADGLHSNSDQSTMDYQMKDFLRFARDAVHQKKIFRLTHSSITTSGYKSTTETANYLLQKLGLTRTPVSVQDEIGTMYSRRDSGYFHLRGYLGNTAHDHLQHLYAMHLMLQATMGQLLNGTGINNRKTMAENFQLSQNFPNPFNQQTVIRYYLPKTSAVVMRIYNSRGELVATPVRQSQTLGWHHLNFNAQALPSGQYFLLLTAGKVHLQRRMLLLK